MVIALISSEPVWKDIYNFKMYRYLLIKRYNLKACYYIIMTFIAIFLHKYLETRINSPNIHDI